MAKAKFCPRCGTPNDLNATFCIKCRYQFKQTKKTSRVKMILLAIILLLLGWVIYRTFTNQPIIPEIISNISKTLAQNKTK